MTRDQWRELRESTAMELYEDVKGSEPEQADERLGYVTVQIDRTLWLRIQAMPTIQEIVVMPNRPPTEVTR